jgi:hypothetical protein
MGSLNLVKHQHNNSLTANKLVHDKKSRPGKRRLSEDQIYAACQLTLNASTGDQVPNPAGL